MQPLGSTENIRPQPPTGTVSTLPSVLLPVGTNINTDNSSSSSPSTSSLSSPPSSSLSSPINPWIKQTIERLHHLFFSHANVPLSSSENVYANLLTQFQTNPQLTPLSVSHYFMMISLWGLARINTCEDSEARRQYGLFINHLQDAEGSLNKSFQIHQKIQHSITPVPSSQVVQSLPLTIQQSANI